MDGKQIETDFAAEARRPLRDLLLLMPHLQCGVEFNIDYESADPALLHQIATTAEITMRTIHRGSAAIGRLLALVSPEIGSGEFSADSMASIGWLLAELGDLAGTTHCLVAACQRYTTDYAPITPKHVPNARP